MTKMCNNAVIEEDNDNIKKEFKNQICPLMSSQLFIYVKIKYKLIPV